MLSDVQYAGPQHHINAVYFTHINTYYRCDYSTKYSPRYNKVFPFPYNTEDIDEFDFVFVMFYSMTLCLSLVIFIHFYISKYNRFAIV